MSEGATGAESPSRAPSTERLIRTTVEELRGDRNVLGVLLVGSWARGDALRGSDVDLEVLVRTRPAKPFQVRHGELAPAPGGEGSAAASPVVEIRFLDADGWRERLNTNPMSLYSFREGRILLQREREMEALAELAADRWRAFRWPDEKVASTLYWLESTRLKVRAAQEEGSSMRAALVLSTSLWSTLEGLWIVNGLPMPAAGGVMAHMDELERLPPDFRADLHGLLLGGSLVAGLRILDWVTQELRAIREG